MRDRLHAVGTEKLIPDILMMKSAEDRACARDAARIDSVVPSWAGMNESPRAR